MTQDFVGAVGYAPTVTIAPANPEQGKYATLWSRDEYRQVAPGEGVAPIFVQTARPKPGAEVIDFGAGTGRGALMIALLSGARVHMLDFADNCLDEEVRQALTTQAHALTFTQHDLTAPAPKSARYGFCTDVMEHIPTDQVELVLKNILAAAQHVFFQISCVDDVMGALIGAPLHLTVQPYAWWLKKLQAMDCVVHWSQDCGSHCMFYVTAWQSGDELVKVGVLNTEEETCRRNVVTNIQAGWQQVQPHETNDVEVMIVGGGPSLGNHFDKIRELRAAGVKLVTLNGAYNWALEHGLKPSAQIVVDARAFNARFTHPVVDDCKYLIASQCDPAVLEGLPVDRTLLWHTTAETYRAELDAHYDAWWVVPGGSTVLLRAIPLLRMLGFVRFHLFGCDSCCADQAHHAYSQPENDGAAFPVIVGDRAFVCQPWMASQAQEFMDLIRFMGDEIELEIYGDGLLAHILRTGAELSTE